MKKKLITALLTSVVMLAAMGIFVWKMSGISDKLSSEDKAKIEEEKDLLENQSGKAIDNVNPIDIKNLYLSGKRKNVVTINYKSPKDVYNQAKSARAEETLTNIKKKFGKNAILKGLNLEDGATAKERNNQIGGHKA